MAPQMDGRKEGAGGRPRHDLSITRRKYGRPVMSAAAVSEDVVADLDPAGEPRGIGCRRQLRV